MCGTRRLSVINSNNNININNNTEGLLPAFLLFQCWSHEFSLFFFSQYAFYVAFYCFLTCHISRVFITKDSMPVNAQLFEGSMQYKSAM